VRTAVYEGVFDDPKTMAGVRIIPSYRPFVPRVFTFYRAVLSF